MDGAYHKIQIVSCVSAKITLVVIMEFSSTRVKKIYQDLLKWVEYGGLGPL